MFMTICKINTNKQPNCLTNSVCFYVSNVSIFYSKRGVYQKTGTKNKASYCIYACLSMGLMFEL